MTNRSRGYWDRLAHSPVAMIATAALIACADETTAVPKQPARISISPDAVSLIVGEAESLTAQAYDASGSPTVASFSWSSSDPAVATVDKASGVVTAISVGKATITAKTRAVSASMTVSVLPSGPAKLTTSTSSLNLIVGSIQRITAEVLDARDRPMAVPVEWSSSNPTVATVGRSDGTVSAIAVGTTAVSAKVGTLTTSVAVSVIELTGSITLARHTNSNNASFTSEVLVYSTRDRVLTPLSRGSALGSISAPAWSPDGTLLAAEAVRSVHEHVDHWMDYESDLLVLGPTVSRTLTADGQSRAPSWSPDGTRIAFVKRTMLFSPRGHIYVISASAGAAVRLTQREGNYDTPRWSPDGAYLAFSDEIGGNRDVFIMDAGGGDLANLTTDAAYDADPSWSPDGTRLAFVSDRYGKRTELFVMGGGTVQRITSLGGWISAPVWSPDGQQVVFTLAASPDYPRGVYIVNADGSSLTHLIAAPANAEDLPFAWRPAAGPAASVERGVSAVNAANTPLAATMQFGQPNVGSPFPPSADHDESSHAKDNLVPRTVVIDRGGTVTFAVPAGVHQIAIYAPGKKPGDIDTASLAPTCPGSLPRLINDTNGRVALITHACGSAWQAKYTFDTPGRYLVICAFLPHFEVGMYGWVEVRDRGS